ncbi:unnamed protein product [Caenorhabditis nigoni]
MSAVPQFKKEFVLKHVFKDVISFEEKVDYYSEEEDHFNVNWSMGVKRLNNHLALCVYCEPKAPSDKWSIKTNLEFKVVGPNRNDVINTQDYCYEKATGRGFRDFLEWEKMEKGYLVNGKLTVEAKVTIIETIGLGKKRIRKFDETQKDVSDNILVVRDAKFYVSKMYLASQSSVFKSLFIENSSVPTVFNGFLSWSLLESKKQKVVLTGVDPIDFESFLEVSFGEESAIDDANVEEVLFLADKFDSEIVKRRCEEFLLKVSKKSFETKQKLADRYHLRNWDFTCSISIANSKTKQFKLRHVFRDAMRFEEGVQNFSEWEDHFHVNWTVIVRRRSNFLDFSICCEPIALSNEWSIRTELEWRVVGTNQNDVIVAGDYCYGRKGGIGLYDFLEWEKLENEYLVNGNLTVEAKVTIIETTGLGKEKIRKFDESQKDVSDVVLVVRNTKFHVSKLFLASQSSVFKTLLLGSTKQSEVKLNGTDPDDFHYFLEVLYGEFAIDDATIEGILMVADKYDTPTVIMRCEEFLMNWSEMVLKKKLQLSAKYSLGELKKKCMSEIETIDDNPMSAVPWFEKQFVLKHVFKDVTNFKEGVYYHSEWEEHFNVEWYMSVGRRKWSIQTRIEFKVVGRNQKDYIQLVHHCYEKIESSGIDDLLNWEEMEKEYLVDGKLIVEARVTIVETKGLGKEKIRKFDESQKDVSDVILEIKDTKFYVSKRFLASQSTVFKALFLGKFSKSKKSEVKLNGIDPNDFHYFLGVLYGESAIDDSNVEGVLLLADKFDAPTGIRKCVEFLLEKSKKALKKKQQMANRYHLGNWDSIHAVSNVNTKTKKFILKHEFKDASSFEEGEDYCSKWEEHFNVDWCMGVRRRNNHLDVFVYCQPIATSDKWSIRNRIECKVVGRYQNDFSTALGYCYEKREGYGFEKYLEWERLENEYLVDGNLTVEAKVTIIETTGFGREKIRKFDESQKDVSDVIIVVRSTKFYVSKKYLTDRSIFFKDILSASSSGSNEFEVILEGVDPTDFHYFLEVLYGESAIDDSTIEGILMVADKYSTPMVVEKCQEFLLNSSEMALRKKLQLSVKYNLGELKKRCMSQIQTIDDVKSIVSGGVHSFDQSIMSELLEKIPRFNNQ